MSNIKNIPHVVDDQIVNVRRAANEARATWAALFYLEAKADGIDLEPIMRRAIHKFGVINGTRELEQFSERPLSASTYCKSFMTRSAPNTFEKELVSDNNDVVDIDFHYCSLVNAWQKLGLDDETCALLCDIAMEGDRGCAEALGLDFELNGSIAEGCEACHLRFKTRK